MNTGAASQLAISDWVNHLASMPEAEFTQQNVHNFIVRHAVELNSLQPHLFFSPERYTRNLVFKNDLFECLVLCWEIGQSSPIHDHGGQLGWIYLATGSLFVQNFRIEDHDRLRHTCRVVPANSAELGLHQDAFVDKDEDVHKVCNLARYNQRAVSIHVYSRPVSSCEIYLPETGSFQVVDLTYTSEYGRFPSRVQSV